eukprot:TRINITY_DN113854_c0_g1_i1.p1 TRINITY_DN113854_c0_g1~~TRINITY_DN113854_c0_g1_i1.p1  ORF type:complete len:584 (+),score=93.03 TRINITY_DN113854_c0_g1_i1:57-1808(+)
MPPDGLLFCCHPTPSSSSTARCAPPSCSSSQASGSTSCGRSSVAAGGASVLRCREDAARIFLDVGHQNHHLLISLSKLRRRVSRWWSRRLKPSALQMLLLLLRPVGSGAVCMHVHTWAVCPELCETSGAGCHSSSSNETGGPGRCVCNGDSCWLRRSKYPEDDPRGWYCGEEDLTDEIVWSVALATIVLLCCFLCVAVAITTHRVSWRKACVVPAEIIKERKKQGGRKAGNYFEHEAALPKSIAVRKKAGFTAGAELDEGKDAIMTKSMTFKDIDAQGSLRQAGDDPAARRRGEEVSRRARRASSASEAAQEGPDTSTASSSSDAASPPAGKETFAFSYPPKLEGVSSSSKNGMRLPGVAEEVAAEAPTPTSPKDLPKERPVAIPVATSPKAGQNPSRRPMGGNVCCAMATISEDNTSPRSPAGGNREPQRPGRRYQDKRNRPGAALLLEVRPPIPPAQERPSQRKEVPPPPPVEARSASPQASPQDSSRRPSAGVALPPIEGSSLRCAALFERRNTRESESLDRECSLAEESPSPGEGSSSGLPAEEVMDEKDREAKGQVIRRLCKEDKCEADVCEASMELN